MIEVNSLWIGPKLSTMEILSIVSHMKQGHVYHLWCYNKPQNVPDGVIVEDGRQILPEQDIFCYQTGIGKGSYSAFSNLFRYKLLSEKNGWWVDTDVVALQSFQFEQEFVFASERTKSNDKHATTCVIGVFGSNEIVQNCYHFASKQNRETLEWSVIGPKLLQQMVCQYKLDAFVVDPHVFCPVDWFDVEKDPPIHNYPNLTGSYAVHLWHEMWRRCGLDKNSIFSAETLYERLKASYLYSHSEMRRDKYRHCIGYL